MRLTRKKAIALCIELWEWLAETGKEKEDWPGWEIYGNAMSNCWFCEYDDQKLARYGRLSRSPHKYCPLVTGGIGRCNMDTYFVQWSEAKTPRTRKKYAKLFLKQIRSLT